MKRTLISIVKSILNAMDSEDVNSLDDSEEARQVASIVEEVYYNTIAVKDIPEHQELTKLTSLSDNDYPTHFDLPDNIKRLEKVWYTDDDGDYYEIPFVEPLSFILTSDKIVDNFDTVLDKNGNTKIKISNDANPTCYTSFDDNYLVMNSYKSTEEDTLQEVKSRALVMAYPTFLKTDDYVPDLDAVLFPMFVAEATSMCMSLLKGQTDPKVEQAAVRQKNFNQNDSFQTRRERRLSKYGR